MRRLCYHARIELSDVTCAGKPVAGQAVDVDITVQELRQDSAQRMNDDEDFTRRDFGPVGRG